MRNPILAHGASARRTATRRHVGVAQIGQDALEHFLQTGPIDLLVVGLRLATGANLEATQLDGRPKTFGEIGRVEHGVDRAMHPFHGIITCGILARMTTAETQTTYLDRLLAPVTQCLTPEVAERLISLRADPDIEARIDELATRANEGQLSGEERAEYEDYIEAVDLIGILQARARTILAKRATD
jgi:hypothetical protein